MIPARHPWHLRSRLWAFLFLLASASCWGADWKALKPQGYLSDFAGVVDAQSKAAIETYAGDVERATGAQMAFVTLNTLDGEPIEDVANDLFHGWGIGQKNKDNGILLLLVTGDRRSRIEIGHGLEAILPDGLDGMLLLQMRPALRANQYGEAMLSAAQSIGTIIAKDKGVAISTSLPQRPRRAERPIHSIPWPLILGALVLFFLFTRGGGRGGGGNFLTGMILGNLLSGGRRDYGGGGWGGGFGGSDSGGGGFGGFGGGDSGGGGASSDW